MYLLIHALISVVVQQIFITKGIPRSSSIQRMMNTMFYVEEMTFVNAPFHYNLGICCILMCQDHAFTVNYTSLVLRNKN